MRRMPRSEHEESPPGRSGRWGWRRLAVLALVPLLALAATSATAQGVWVTVPPMPTPRNAFGAATAHCPDGVRGTCVYTAGGSFGADRLEAYSPRSNTWVRLPSLQTPRVSLATSTAPCPGGVKGDCVYAIGGVTDDNFVATNEAFSTETGTWLTLTPMPTARSAMAAATAPCPDGLGLRGVCVYVFGGNGGTATVSTVEAYSPATDTWATLAPLQIPRLGHGGTAAPCPGDLKLKGTCVYAMGGSNLTGVLASAEVYSPVLNSWTRLPDMPTGRDDGLAAATAPCPEGVSDGCVYALGGFGTGGTLTTAEAYSPVANAWLTLPAMPTAHREFAAATAPCPNYAKRVCVYAIGGFFSNGSDVNGATEAFAIERAERTHKPKPRPTPAGAPVEDAAASDDRAQVPQPAGTPSPAAAPAPASTTPPARTPTPTPAATPTPMPSAVTSIGFRPPAAPAASPSATP